MSQAPSCVAVPQNALVITPASLVGVSFWVERDQVVETHLQLLHALCKQHALRRATAHERQNEQRR